MLYIILYLYIYIHELNIPFMIGQVEHFHLLMHLKMFAWSVYLIIMYTRLLHIYYYWLYYIYNIHMNVRKYLFLLWDKWNVTTIKSYDLMIEESWQDTELKQQFFACFYFCARKYICFIQIYTIEIMHKERPMSFTNKTWYIHRTIISEILWAWKAFIRWHFSDRTNEFACDFAVCVEILFRNDS